MAAWRGGGEAVTVVGISCGTPPPTIPHCCPSRDILDGLPCVWSPQPQSFNYQRVKYAMLPQRKWQSIPAVLLTRPCPIMLIFSILLCC